MQQTPLQIITALLFAGGIQYALAETETNGGTNSSREASLSEGSLYNTDFAQVMTNEHAIRWREYTKKGHTLFSEMYAVLFRSNILQ